MISYIPDNGTIIGAVGGVCALIVVLLTSFLLAIVCVIKKQKFHRADFKGTFSYMANNPLFGDECLQVHIE